MATYYMHTVTVSLTNSSVMNIVGVSAGKDEGKAVNDEILKTYRTGSVDDLTEVLKKYGVNVYMDEVPYRMGNISEVREEAFKKDLDIFLNKKGGKFNVGTNSVLPIEISRGF